MSERGAAYAAGCVAFVLVGGLGVASYRRLSGPSKEPLVPTLLSRQVEPATADAGSALWFKILPPRNRPLPEDPDEDEEAIEYKVVDASGRVYATATGRGARPITLSASLGLPAPVVRPRILVVIDGVVRGALELAPFPKPEPRALPARRDRRLRAYVAMRSEAGPNNLFGPHLVLAPRSPLPKGEIWTVKVRETNLGGGPLPPRVGSGPTPRVPEAPGDIYRREYISEFIFRAPYPEGLRAVRVSVTRQQEKRTGGRYALDDLGSFEATLPVEKEKP